MTLNDLFERRPEPRRVQVAFEQHRTLAAVSIRR